MVYRRSPSTVHDVCSMKRTLFLSVPCFWLFSIASNIVGGLSTGFSYDEQHDARCMIIGPLCSNSRMCLINSFYTTFPPVVFHVCRDSHILEAPEVSSPDSVYAAMKKAGGMD